MSFLDYLKEPIVNNIKVQKENKTLILNENDEGAKPEDILRNSGYKIKLVTKTAFGTQIDFAKKYDEEELKEVLHGYNIKIKNNTIFVVN